MPLTNPQSGKFYSDEDVKGGTKLGGATRASGLVISGGLGLKRQGQRLLLGAWRKMGAGELRGATGKRGKKREVGDRSGW